MIIISSFPRAGEMPSVDLTSVIVWTTRAVTADWVALLPCKPARFFETTDMKTSISPVLIIFALVCFAFEQNTEAVSPPPDGCYKGFTTAEGCLALQNLTSGTGNIGVGPHDDGGRAASSKLQHSVLRSSQSYRRDCESIASHDGLQAFCRP